MSQVDQHSPGTVVYRSTQRRTFKACRTCRQQKARCIGAEDPPCKRCRSTGRDCVFEELVVGGNRKRSQPASTGNESHSKRPSGARIRDPDNEVSRPQSLVDNNDIIPASDSPRQPRISQSCSVPSQPNLRDGFTRIGTQSGQALQSSILVEDSTSPADLTLLHLDAPITAVEAMSMKGLPPSPASIQSQDSVPSNTSVPGRNSRDETLHIALQRPNDVISAGLITEFEARKLFQLYMANANVFLPIFDPAVDGFDAVRKNSTICFTVILAIALKAEHSGSASRVKGDRCFLEAQNLATQSLFASFARLETIQGILLLAAYSDKNWFAISHAYQMGSDMGLPDIINDESNTLKSANTLQTLSDRRFVCRTRTALILHHVEQEVASGTTRKSKGRPVSGAFIKKFLSNKFLNTYDMRIAANVEIVQLRGRLLQELEEENSHIGTIQQWIRRIEGEIDEWFNHWDSIFQGQDIGVGCFQRSSIRLQRDYAFIIVCSAIISKMSSGSTAEPAGDMLTEEMRDIVHLTFERSVKILDFIAENNDYKWYLQWAPTYSALFPAFTAALAFRLARLRSSATDWRALQSSFIKVADILENYPYQHFALIIRDLSRLCYEIFHSQAAKRGVENRRIRESRLSRSQSDHAEFDDTEMDHDTSNSLNNFDPVTELHNQDQAVEHEEEITVSAVPSNTGNATSTTFFDTGNEREGWIPGSASHFSIHDNNIAPEQLDMQSLLTMPDYIFDFNLFATSMQSSTDDHYFPGRT